MTVGIAVMCDDGRSVVLAADRKTTLSMGYAIIQSDTDCKKVRRLGPSTVIAFSGDLGYLERVLVRLGDISGLSGAKLAEEFYSECRKLREDELNRVFGKYGVGLKAFHDGVSNQTLNMTLLEEVKKLDSPGIFLIASAGTSTTSLHMVSDMVLADRADPGFGAIGSGQHACHPLCVARGAYKGMPLEDAVYLAYESKRHAESDYGVGAQTDMIIVGVDRPAEPLTEPAIDQLSRIYESRQKLKSTDRKAIRRLIGD